VNPIIWLILSSYERTLRKSDIRGALDELFKDSLVRFNQADWKFYSSERLKGNFNLKGEGIGILWTGKSLKTGRIFHSVNIEKLQIEVVNLNSRYRWLVDKGEIRKEFILFMIW